MKYPTVLTVNAATIPDELKALPQWCVWAYLWNEERQDFTKVPLQARAALKGKGENARSNNPKTWATFDEAIEAYTLHPVPDDYTSDNPEIALSGVGFFLSNNDPFIGVDLDKVLEDEQFTNEDAHLIVETLNSYTEISPSSKGLRIFVKGKKPGTKSRKGFLEMYDGSGARYLTVTGQVFHNAPINDRQSQIEDIYHRYLFNPNEAQPLSNATRGSAFHNNVGDSDLLKAMFDGKKGATIKALWEGETSGYPSASEADLALCNHLAWWADYDPMQLDSLYRQSALYRAKWDERHSGDGATYGELTIQKACAGKARGEGYKPKKRKGKNKAGESNQTSEGENQIGFYVEKGNELFSRKEVNDEITDTRLCNFTARIVAQVERDDGAEITRHLAIKGTLANGKTLPRASVPASQFGSMNWVLEHWGVSAIVSAGQSAKDKIREAVQMFSDKDSVVLETTYTHLGWRETNNEWVYLHAGGAIGKNGTVSSVSVDAGSALSQYQLPAPKELHEATDALKASFEMLEVAPDNLTIPLFLGVYRAVIEGADFALYLAGLTGVRKSELAALALQHFGKGLDSRHLPGNWSSTGNSLEVLAFAAKDALIVVDDFAPQGNQSEQARYHSTADRLFRAQGNSQGRGRLKNDGSSRPPKPPRGLILSTGEELPRAHSIRARSLILEVKPNDVDLMKLTQCQKDAASGLYASALASFIQWLAPRLEQSREQLRQGRTTYRANFISSHGRTTDACAELMFTADVWCDFAREAGLFNEQECEDFRARVFSTLQEIAGSQAQHQRDADPVERFGLLLIGVLTSGKGHLTKLTGENPDNPEKWGYKGIATTTVYGTSTTYQPQGSKMGWLPDDLEKEGLYLEPEAAYAAVQQLAQQQNETLSMTKTTLYKRMLERGFALKNQKDRNTFKTTIEGKQREVIKLNTLYLEKIGIVGIVGINATKSSVDEGFDYPDSQNCKSQNGIIGIVEDDPEKHYPETNRDSQKNRDSKTVTKSSVDAKNPDYPDYPDSTDTPPSRFLEKSEHAKSEVSDDLSV